MNVYPDFNIIDALEKKRISINDIKKSLNDENLNFYYSQAHLYETDTMTGYNGLSKEQVVLKRLNVIDELTGKKYLRQTQEKKLSPSIKSSVEAYKSINDYPEKEKIATGFTDIAPFAAREVLRQLLNIDVQYLNNLSAEQTVTYLNEKYKAAGLQQTFSETLQEAYTQIEKTSILSTYDKIAIIFSLLDIIGFYRDKETSKSDFARIWDSNHAYFACHYDVFITNDKRALKKTEIAYELLGIKTKIIPIKI